MSGRGTKVTLLPCVTGTKLPLVETELRQAALPEKRRKAVRARVAQAPIIPRVFRRKLGHVQRFAGLSQLHTGLEHEDRSGGFVADAKSAGRCWQKCVWLARP
jgi:hypothetical protein